LSHPYAAFVRRFSALLKDASRLPRGGFAPVKTPSPTRGAPRVLILAPHPDDECIVGLLPLRLQRELGCRVGVVAATLGSRRDRRAPRRAELRGACGFLGWDVVAFDAAGAIDVKPPVRRNNPRGWKKSAAALTRVLREWKPAIVFVPHAGDANATHQGVHLLALDALRALGPAFRCAVVETEFWSTLSDPNLMIEATAAHAADLAAALSFHDGEVARNPYHALLPCWLVDGVRRGAELVGGQGAAAPAFEFAALYRLGRWNGKSIRRAPGPGLVLPAGRGLRRIFNHRDTKTRRTNGKKG